MDQLRLISHVSLLGALALGLAFARLPWQQWGTPSQNLVAPFFSTGPLMASPRASPNEPEQHHLGSGPALESSSLARLAELHTHILNLTRPSLVLYTITAGDTPFSIASQFNLKPESILWANPLLSENAEALRVGTVINILPINGVLHFASEGDTVERLQLLYGVSVEDIVTYPGNDFPEEPPYPLVPGQKVIIPGGRKPIVWQEPGPPLVAGHGRKSPGYFSGPLVRIGTGNFIWPVTPDVITQYYWAGHPAIDIDTYLGQPVVASDSGTVIFSGWDTTGFGNLIIIDHGNDLWTYYAHNSQSLVSAGQGIDQRQTIALSGSTGNSTGNHLDFRIRYQAEAFLDPIQFLP